MKTKQTKTVTLYIIAIALISHIIHMNLKMKLPHKTFSEATEKMGRLRHLIHSVNSRNHKNIRADKEGGFVSSLGMARRFFTILTYF